MLRGAMAEDELLEYIKNRLYMCAYCRGLQSRVMQRGLQAIPEWDGWICSGVEDMKIRYSMIGKHFVTRKWTQLTFDDLY